MTVIRYDNIPAVASTAFGFCLPAAMVSAIRTVVPDSTITPRELYCIAGNQQHQGVGIAEAAILFNAMGLQATAYSKTLGSVPSPSKSFSRLVSYQDKPDSCFLVRKRLSSSDLRSLMADREMVIVCTDLGGVGHAEILTGFTSQHFLHHRTTYSHPHRPDPVAHAVIHEDVLEMGRHGHDYHTLVVHGAASHVKREIRRWERYLAALKWVAVAQHLEDKGVRRDVPFLPIRPAR